jgi:hypothetical protein
MSSGPIDLAFRQRDQGDEDGAWLKGTKISIRRLIRSNVRHCAASSHHGRKDVGVRSSVPRFLHPVAPRVGYDFDGNTRSLIIA